MNDVYQYLFPFEKVPQKSRILIYGAGEVGQAYLKQILLTRYCEVIGFLDRAYESYQNLVVPVYPPTQVQKIDYDYIIVAMKVASTLSYIKEILHNAGVDEEKVVFTGVRPDIVTLTIADTVCVDKVDVVPAYKNAGLSIALKFGGHLGDAIIKKRLFREIVTMAPEAKIDIYTPGGGKFIKSLYADEPNLNCVIDDGGGLYVARHKEYMLSMSIFYMIEINYIDYQHLHKLNPIFADKMKLHRKRHDEYGLKLFPSTQNYIHFARTMYLRRNCYSIYNYTGVFNIDDQKVDIPLNLDYFDEYQSLRIGKYVTFNFGNGTTGKNNKNSISKQWPKEYFEEFALLFKKKYKNIKLIQLGDDNTEPIEGADECLLGKNLELVKIILHRAILHVDIEGGLMHLATQLGTKCVVLYGSTPIELFGYPQNVNIQAGKCKNCYMLYDNYYRCVRNMEKPECMWSIKPKFVLEKINLFISRSMKDF